MNVNLLKLEELIRDMFPEETKNIIITPETVLRSVSINLEGSTIDFELSSIQCIELIVAIEKDFNISIDIEQLDNFRTMGDLLDITQQ